jgi:hypothetical protein
MPTPTSPSTSPYVHTIRSLPNSTKQKKKEEELTFSRRWWCKQMDNLGACVVHFYNSFYDAAHYWWTENEQSIVKALKPQ